MILTIRGMSRLECEDRSPHAAHEWYAGLVPDPYFCPGTRHDGQSVEPMLVEIDVVVCELCLRGRGSVCHVPGCMFWMEDVPTLQERALLRIAVKLTKLATVYDKG